MTSFLSFLLFLGGSGFLGQHIVRLIEERDPTVKEIRIVDLRPYENRLSKYQAKGRKTKKKTQNENKTREKLISTQFRPISISHHSTCLFFSLLLHRQRRIFFQLLFFFPFSIC